MGGFECSTHRPRHGTRLDIIAATQHDRFVEQDYARLRERGMFTVRDGLRWHLIEQTPGRYDWSSVLPMIRAARDGGMQVMWDLCHYGWPDDIDIFKPEFVNRFAQFTRAFVRLLADETDDVPFIVPINEISFFAWATGVVDYIFPYAVGRAVEIKWQLLRAAVASIEAAWSVNPRTRVVHTDPMINVMADPSRPQDRPLAEIYTRSQYDAWNILAGLQEPQFGGHIKYLDIVGVNYYPHNQWIYRDLPFNPAFAMHRSHPLYKPFREILSDVYERYRRPLFVAETGADGEERADWLRYIGGEVRAAIQAGVPVEGICWYPIVNFPWWDDGHHLHNALWDYADENGEREIYQPLADELAREQQLFAELIEQPQLVPESFQIPLTMEV